MRVTLGRALPFLAGLLLLTAVTAGAEDQIFQIQLGAVPQNTVVDVQGVVVTGVAVYGFFIQEPNPDPVYGRQYSGVFVYTGSSAVITARRGDMVNVRGVYLEYYGRAEIDLTKPPLGTYTILSHNATIPDPVQVTIAEVNTAGALAEAYEGVLVKVDRLDPTLFAGKTLFSNEWTLWPITPVYPPTTGDTLQVRVFPTGPGGDFEYSIPAQGTPISFVQGIMDYAYSKFAILPRDCDGDLGMACIPKLRGAYATNPAGVAVQFGVDVDSVSAADASHYELGSGYSVYTSTRDPNNHKRIFLTTDDLGNAQQETITVTGVLSDQGVPMVGSGFAAFRTGITPIRTIQFVAAPAVNDDSPLNNEIVTIVGKVVGIQGGYYFLSDDDGKEWDNLYVRVLARTALKLGDQLKVAGRVSEYPATGTLHMTELVFSSGVDYQVLVGSGGTVTPNVVTATQVRWQRDPANAAEAWESALVHLNAATLLDSAAGQGGSPYFGEYTVKQATSPDTAFVDINQIIDPNAYAACAGDVINVTGLLWYDFNVYRISPRSGRGYDIQVTYDNPACAPTSVEDGLADLIPPRLANHPNPFGRTTTIRFTLPTADRILLEILDPAGRVVRTLRDHVAVQPGEQQVVWDGRNDAGHPVGSGTYFARLKTLTGETASKLIVVK
jgi:hypothetical protein